MIFFQEYISVDILIFVSFSVHEINGRNLQYMMADVTKSAGSIAVKSAVRIRPTSRPYDFNRQ